MAKITFPKIDDEGAGLCFIRKYRQNQVTRYIFYKANINKKISDEIIRWLQSNISQINNKDIAEYTIDNYRDKEYIILDAVDNWNFFKKSAFDLAHQEVTDLNYIKHHLIGFIIYIKLENCIIGQIRKVTSKNLLNKKGLYTLFMDNSSFNELREQKGIEIDKKADILFKFTSDKSEGIIFDKYDFNSIFDIFEQEKKDSLKLLKLCHLIETHKDKTDIHKLVSEDRTLQRMVLNPLVKEHLNEVTFDTINELKKEIPSKILFNIDEKNRRLVLPDNGKKEAIQQLIKIISYKFTRSLDTTHILEGTPSKVIK